MTSLLARFDLGLRKLLPEWRTLLRPAGLREDIVAGATVACVAIPLSLAIAIASSVAPGVGLVTAIVSGIVCALFGGTPLAVCGPAAAISVVIADVVAHFGIGGLLVVGLLAGLLQVLTGVLGLGRLIRLLPVSLIQGFTAGVGAIIFIGQLPRAFGLAAPASSGALAVLRHLAGQSSHVSGAAAAFSLGAFAITLWLPRWAPKVPAPLLAVIVPTLAAVVFGASVETLGALPRSLPAPALPALPPAHEALRLVGPGLFVFAVASLQTLLSSSAVDKMVKGSKYDPDQELIGQGLGNIACSLFAGIPVSGVIARSAINVQAGARTRRSSVFHSLMILLAVFVAAPLLARVPIAALSGVLLAVAVRMIDVAQLRELWRTARGDAFVYATTFVAIVASDLLVGIEWGFVVAMLTLAIGTGLPHATVQIARTDGVHRLALQGPLTFLSSLRMDSVVDQARKLTRGKAVIIDLADVTRVDASGAEHVQELVTELSSRGLSVALTGLRPEWKTFFARSGGERARGAKIVDSERELEDALQLPSRPGLYGRLAMGVDRFRRVLRPRYEPLFRELAHGQAPHTLFITCSDSRIQPHLLTSSDPGDLFILRNIGNMVCPHCASENAEGPPSLSASQGAIIEYAVAILGVRNVIVCGHSGCGAIKAIRGHHPVPETLENLQAWLRDQRRDYGLDRYPHSMPDDDVARLNVLQQLDNLRSHPVVAARIAEGKLNLFGWFFDIARGDVEAWSSERGRFVPVGAERPGTTRRNVVMAPESRPVAT